MFIRKASRFPYYLTVINTGINTGSDAIHVSPADLGCLKNQGKGTVVFHSREQIAKEELSFKDHGINLEPFDVIVIKFDAEE